MTAVGYIGLGAMGSAIAEQLQPHVELHVFDVDKSKMHYFTGLGAVTCASAAELAARCRIILLCLPTSAEVQEVLFGPNGIASGMQPNTLVIDQTSGHPDKTRWMANELAALDAVLLDAPVSGGPNGARAGTLSIMLGGPAEKLEEALPILNQISPNIFRCGDTGSGQVVKMVNNAIAACHRAVTLEAIAVGAVNGLSLDTMEQVINAGSGKNGASEKIFRTLTEGIPSSALSLELMIKDLRQANKLAHDSGAPMFVLQPVQDLFLACINTYGADKSVDQLAATIAHAAGISDWRNVG